MGLGTKTKRGEIEGRKDSASCPEVVEQEADCGRKE